MENEISKPKYGLVGFFDILGYQAFLDANGDDPGEVTNTVLSTLSSLKEKASARFDAVVKELKSTADQIANYEWLVFSDTILLTAEIPRSEDDYTTLLRIIFFLIQSAVLSRHMFDEGLPLRGAIEIGNYFTKGNCFAGKPIVDAHRQSNVMELAATAVSKDVLALHTKMNRETNIPLQPLVSTNYCTPSKHGEIPLNLIVPSFYPSDDEKSWGNMDLRQLVLESFWAHRKQLNGSARAKAANTEDFLRYLKMKRPDFA